MSEKYTNQDLLRVASTRTFILLPLEHLYHLSDSFFIWADEKKLLIVVSGLLSSRVSLQKMGSYGVFLGIGSHGRSVDSPRNFRVELTILVHIYGPLLHSPPPEWHKAMKTPMDVEK